MIKGTQFCPSTIDIKITHYFGCQNRAQKTVLLLNQDLTCNGTTGINPDFAVPRSVLGWVFL